MRNVPLAPIAFFNPLQTDSRSWRTDLGAEGLYTICERLNLPEGDAEREELRRLVGAWQASGPSLCVMLHKKPELRDSLVACMQLAWTPTFSAGAKLNVFPSFPPEGGRGRKKSLEVAPYWSADAAKKRALSSFWLLTVNLGCERLAGPCARCGNYFIRKRSTQKVYCSRRCGNASTAVARTRARLETEHRDKMRRAEAAIRAWNALQTRGKHDWLEWLGEREPDITGKFITRHVNAGKLPEPKRGRRSL